MRPEALPAMIGSRNWSAALGAGLLGAGLLALLSRAVIDHPVHYDELLHILAARGLIRSGLPAIADGLYERAELYTRAVAWSFRAFGDSAVSARLPALAAGAALALLMGTWLTRKAGLLAGALGVVVLCSLPMTIDVSVFARFYTVHALLMALLFIAAFEATQPGRSRQFRVGAAAAAAILIPLGWHFQETTVIAIGAAVAATGAVLLLDHWAGARAFVLRRPALVLVTLAAMALLALAALTYGGLLDVFNGTALWAARDAARPQFYIVGLRDALPLLWPLLPLAAALAISRPDHRRLGIFCVVLAASALVVHSIAAQKTMRYVYYLAPWMSVLWAIAVAEVVAGARTRGRLALPIAMALLAAAFALSLEGSRTLNLAAGRTANLEQRPFRDEPDWTPIVAQLAPRVREATRVVSSNSMKALYYLGRYDFELNATIVPETETGTEFGVDARSGRQAIGADASIARVLAMPGTTLVVIEESKIGRESGVTTAAFTEIELRCGELRLAPGSGARAWWCDSSPAPR
jgi:hypothetical protein